MRKWLLSLCVLGSVCSLHASSVVLEGKFSYFRPDSHRLRQIFPGWMPIYQLETRVGVGADFWFWGSVGYLTKQGHSLGDHQRVGLHVVPITAGMEYVSSFSNRYKPYVGAGARYFFVNVVNHSRYVHGTDSGNGLGGAFRIGSLICLAEHCVLDLCVDYSLKTVDFSGSSSTVERHDLDLSGLSLGVGLGYSW